MKALTVRQPFTWAILYEGKTPENRTSRWRHRGPLAIHAAGKPAAPEAWEGVSTILGIPPLPRPERGHRIGIAGHPAYITGAIMGMVDVIDGHEWSVGCCGDSPWAERGRHFRRAGSIVRTFHLVLANPRILPEPVPYEGALNLWDVPDEVMAGAVAR